MFSQRVLRSSAPLLGTVVIGGGLLATSYFKSSQTQPPLPQAVDQTMQHSSQSPKDPKKFFTSGFSFQDLKLESSEVVNHDTKRLRFELPDKDAVSGLRASCTFGSMPCLLPALILYSCTPDQSHPIWCLATCPAAIYPNQ